MQTPCSHCPYEAIGTEAASACVECGSVAVAGASMSLPMMLLIAGSIALVCVVASRLPLGRMVFGRRQVSA